MSFQAERYVRQLREVTGYEKLLLFVLADYHNFEKNAAWPSIPHLAEDAGGMSERNVKYLLAKLEDPREGHPEGILSRKRRHEGRGAIYEYNFVEMAGKGANKGAKKGANGDIAIRKNSLTVLKEDPPLTPPSEREGNSSYPKLTSRKITQLSDRIYCLMNDPRLDMQTAFHEACEQLLIPPAIALDALKGTALAEAVTSNRMPPRRAAG